MQSRGSKTCVANGARPARQSTRRSTDYGEPSLPSETCALRHRSRHLPPPSIPTSRWRSSRIAGCVVERHQGRCRIFDGVNYSGVLLLPARVSTKAKIAFHCRRPRRRSNSMSFAPVTYLGFICWYALPPRILVSCPTRRLNLTRRDRQMPKDRHNPPRASTSVNSPLA
jgi:hypothetical protein